MDKSNIEQLQKLAKVFNTDNVITAAEIEQVLKGIMSIMASFKKSGETLTAETLEKINDAVLKIEKQDSGMNLSKAQEVLRAVQEQHEEIIQNVSQETSSHKKEMMSKMEKSIKEMENMCERIMMHKPRDGRDADEKVMIEKVLGKIIIPKYEEVILDEAEQIKDKLETLKGKDRLDAKAIKNLPKMVQSYAGGAGNIKDIVAGTNITVDNTNLGYPVINSVGAGDMLLGTAQTVTAVKTFLNTTMKLRNVANTFDGYFANTNTADRIYTLKDAAGTIAFTSDITGTNSNINTGDETQATIKTKLGAASAGVDGYLTGTDWSTFNGKQAAGSYEVTTNKATDFTTVNNTLYPTVQAVNNAINTAVTGLLDYRGSYDASTNLFPATGGSGLAGAVLKGDFWICSVAGTLGGTAITAGDLIIALVDTPAQTASNWDLISNELGYTPENAANKVTSISGASTDVQYPSAKLVYDQLALKAPLASPTFTGNLTTPTVKITGGTPGLGKVLTSDADGDATWETPSAGGSSLWTLMPGTPTRVGNTSFTVTGDITSYIAKGMIIKWTESSTVRVGMVSIPSTYGAPNTTITIIGDTMASIDASSLKYCMLGVEMFQKNFAVAGTIGATGTDIANAYYATEPMRVIGMDLQHGTAGVTTTFVMDCNKNGTTMFTVKPSLATTVASSPLPFTADSATSLALGDRVSIDIDTINTGTLAIDLYTQLYVFPTRYLSLT